MKKQQRIAIIGGSFSGLRLAQALAKSSSSGRDNFHVQVFEKRNDSRGTWSTTEGSANTSSSLQIESYVYCPASCPYPGAKEIGQTLDNMAEDVKKHGVDLLYGCSVTRIEQETEGHDGDESIILTIFNSKGEERKERFSSVHVRTGTLSQPRRLHIPGLEKHLHKRWCLGVRDELENISVENRHVVIVGLGAFAVENAKRAIERGAGSVTFISRSDSYVAPRFLMHQSALDLLDPAAMWLPRVTDERWQQICDVLRHTPKTPEYDFSSRIIKYQGKDHFLFTSSAQSDWFYAALAMGAVRVIRGQVVEAESGSVAVIVDGEKQRVPADVLVVCAGHTCDTSLLDNIPLTAVMFGMDGKLTHNLRVDVMPNPTLFGPRCAVPHFPALSYGLVSDFVDTLTVRSITDPSFFQAFAMTYRLCQHPEQAFVADIDGRHWIKLFYKCIVNRFPLLGCRIYNLLLERRRTYCDLARSGQDWYSYAVEDWNKNVAKLRAWQRKRQQRNNDPDDEEKPLPPFPWPKPKSGKKSVIAMRNKWFYLVLYFFVACANVERAQYLLVAVPILQEILRIVL